MKFNEFNLSAELLAEIEKAGFVEASPIQEQTIPLALEGKDVIGQAQTGTGKTAAFGLPTLEKIDVDNTVIQALVIAPTRELAVQSQEELFRFGRSKGVKVRSVYGGSSIEKQIKALKSGAHIVVGTPGRLLDYSGAHIDISTKENTGKDFFSIGFTYFYAVCVLSNWLL